MGQRGDQSEVGDRCNHWFMGGDEVGRGEKKPRRTGECVWKENTGVLVCGVGLEIRTIIFHSIAL